MALGRSGRGKGGSLVLLGIVFMVFVILLAILYGIYYYNVSSGEKQGHRTTTTTTTGWSAKYFYIHIVADWYIDDGEITVLELIGRDSPIPSSIPLSIGGTSDYMKIYVYGGDGSLIAYKEELLYSGDVEKFVDVTGLKGHYITVKIQLVNVDVGMYGIPDETVVDEREGTFYVG